MPSFRERLADLIDGGQRQQEINALTESVRKLWGAYLDGPFVQTPEDTIRDLMETTYDSSALVQLVYDLEYDNLMGYATQETTRRERDLAVKQSARLWRYDPLAQWSIWLWTGWGLGDRITLKLEDENAQEWWDEFFSSERNAPLFADDQIHNLSDWLLVKGNRFLAFYASTLDGEGTVRVLPQEEIVAILCNPDDSKQTWFYKREYNVGQKKTTKNRTLYYPDWRLFFADGNALEDAWRRLQEDGTISADAKRADTIQKNGDEKNAINTVVCVLHIAHNQKEESSPWGWPITTTSAPWMRAHKQFMQSRLGVAMAKAQFVRRSTTKGGSRGVTSVLDAIQSTLSQTNFQDTNPPASPGSWHVQNDAMKTEELPMRTGADDAEKDWKIFAHQALLGSGLFPTSAGMDTSRWATAVEMDKAQSMLFERYQTFWSAQFRRIVTIVLNFGERYARQSFASHTVEVSIDTFSLVDFPSIAGTIGTLVSQSLTPLVMDGTIPQDAARSISANLWRICLQSLGISDANELTSDESFEIAPTTEEKGSPQTRDTGLVEMIARVATNYRSGSVSADDVVEFVLTELLEARA